ncbi:MAG: rhodanese-like domain-containing protein [Vulcanococcus sp.]
MRLIALVAFVTASEIAVNAAADAGIARGRRRLIRRNSQHAVHSTERVSAQELAELLSSQRVAVIDVREPMEYAAG